MCPAEAREIQASDQLTRCEKEGSKITQLIALENVEKENGLSRNDKKSKLGQMEKDRPGKTE